MDIVSIDFVRNVNVAVFCQSISEVNHLLYACSLVVAERLGLRKKRTGGRKEKEEPWWKRRIGKSRNGEKT